MPSAGDDWEQLSTASGWPYTGGQICLVVDAGGLVTYSTTSDTYDATFDLGLALPSAPVPAPPLETPAQASTAVGAGTSVTLAASSAGLTPLSYQWQTDGGSGQTPTNIAAATGTTLVVDTTGWAPGTYVYDFMAANSLGSVTSPTVNIVIVPILMADLGTNPPTPGPQDITQLQYTPGFYTPGGLNYYTDDGAGHSAWAGQTFTTGTNADGYIMNSLTWKSSGNGNSFSDIQLYDFYVFSVSGTPATATQIASYQGNGGGVEGDWFKFVGLNVTLAPNSQYAYAFGRDSTATGWEDIASSSNSVGPYSGGQVCTIFPATGGPITYGTGGAFDATFDVGLTASTLPFSSAPTYSPNVTPVYDGTIVTLNEDASGTPPLSFQWFADNGSGGSTWTPVSGATSSNLVVDTTSLTGFTYEYEVVVKNNSGSVTSAPVTLNTTPASAPVVVSATTPGPVNEGYIGENATFSGSFAGTLPFTYQWMVNTGTGFKALSDATNDTLVLTNLQAANAGTYYLSAQNSVGGPVTNTPSTLTVLTDPGAPAAGSYGAAVLADQPLGYWPLNETGDTSTGVLPAYDASGHNLDGVYGQYSVDGVSGPTPSSGFPGFSASNTALQPQTDSADTYVTIPSLNINTNTVTITAWINPSANEPADAGLVLYRNVDNSDAAGLGFGGTVNVAGMPGLGYVWNSNSAATYGYSSGLYPPVGQWSFVALVIQPSNATLYLYELDPVTGKPDLYSAVNTVTNGVETFADASGGTNAIGTDPYSQANRAFGGSIDQVAVFDTALTGNQILAIFGKAMGLSSFAASISSQPQSVGAYAGANLTLSAGGINGTSPFTYQWQLNGANISDATNLSLTLSTVTSAVEGTYTLLVNNSVGTTVSSNAVVSVVTPVPGSYEAAVLKYNPMAFWRLNETNADPSIGTALAFEDVSGLTGAYQVNSMDGWNGVQGPQAPQFPGFPTSNTALETLSTTTGNSFVIAGPTNVVASNLTYTLWINPQSPVGNWAGLIMNRTGVGNGLGFGGAVNSAGMSQLAFTWDQNNTWTNFNNEAGNPPGLFPPLDEWSFVAMVIEPSQGTLYLINTNGIQTSVDPIAMDAESFGNAWHIGSDANDGNTGDRTFPGMISSVGVFLSALSSNQVVSLYDAGVGITPPSQGGVTINIAKAAIGGSLIVSWPAGTLVQATNVTGPWITNAAPSPYTLSPTNSQMFFEVR